MPPTRHRNSGPQAASSARQEPYDKPSPDKNDTSAENKENQSPQTSNSSKKRTPKQPDRSNLPENYLDIELEEIKGEVPVYENASAIRRKLNNLLDKKTKIPGTNKPFNKTSLSQELQKIGERHHSVKTGYSTSEGGGSARSLTTFLKKSGTMGGGDSQVYYFGNMLLEKLRIWNGEKKTAARLKAEKEFPNGRVRMDPKNTWITCREGERPSYNEMANEGR